jgi:alanine racemase
VIFVKKTNQKSYKFGKIMISHNNQPSHPHHSTNNHHINSQTFIELNSSAFNHNVAYYKNLIGLHNQLAVVIKANGYGHGLTQMAYLCEQNSSVNWLAVMHLSEALALEHITKPILVLGYSDVNPEYAIHKNIHFMVDQLEYAQNLNIIGKQHSYQFNVHVKIDTGLSRLGVLSHEAIFFITQLKKLDYITIAGIYSHFAASDSNPEFTAQQYTQFNNVITDLNIHTIHIPNIHMSNSAAVSKIEYQPYFNLFRIGIGVYGLGYDKEFLKPVMTWKTHITNIKTVPAFSFIGYAGTYKTQRLTRIALLPVGYFDGYKFEFSNKTSVLINGSYAPVIGRVAMNMTIIDVTDITTSIGDEVIILGPYLHINAHDLALKANIPNVREILVGINPALNRIIII